MIRRLASAGAVIAGCVAALVLAGAGGGSPQPTVRIAFNNAFGITQGGDLRVAGVKAGQTTGFDITNDPRVCHHSTTCAVVTAQVNRPGFQSFRADASCAIRQQSLIGEYYVDCQPGSAPEPLPKNATIGDTHTNSTIPADLVGDIMRQPYRDRLRLIVGELGTGLAGRPQDVAQLLHNASPALQQTDQVLRILAGQHQIIQNFITDSNTVVTQLDQNKADVARWIARAGTTARISAGRASNIELGIQRFPAFLDGLRTNMTDLGALVDAQSPLLHELQATAPSLHTFLTKLGPFSSASTPNIRTLGQAAALGTRAFRGSKRDIDQLEAIAADAPATARPLRQFLQTLDSRQRSAEPDSSAQATAPPAPDPAGWISGKGFTGMEALLNYFYYQTLAINQFDSVSHFLSTENNIDPICSPWLTPAQLTGSAANDAVRKRCTDYMGPYQPGVTSPDPTAQGAAPEITSAGAEPARGSLAATRPLPGQVDYSQPHPTSPASTQQLLASLTSQPPPASPGAITAQPPPVMSASPGASTPTSPAAIDAALNYLLGP